MVEVYVGRVSGEGFQDEPRHGSRRGIHCGYDRPVHLVGILGHLLEAVGHLYQLGVEIGARPELQGDGGDALLALAVYLREAGHGLQLVFLLVHYLAFHLEGTRPPPRGGHGDLEALHVGGELHRYPEKGDEAEDEDEDDADQDGDRVLYGGFYELHGPTILTFCMGMSLSLPLTTTSSPGASAPST